MKYLLIFIGVIIFVFVVRLGELQTQPGRYQNYWDRRNQLPARNNQILYIALGDSTAQGIGANKPDNGYPGLIADKLEAEYGKPVRLINLSKSGAKIDHALEVQLPKLKDHEINKSTILTIEIGANDMKSFEPGKFESEMDSLMSQLPKQTTISDIPYFGGGLFRNLEPNVEKANKIMYKLAEKHGFKLASLHDKIKANSGPRTFAADYFHPSTYGYKTNWAPVFIETLDAAK